MKNLRFVLISVICFILIFSGCAQKSPNTSENKTKGGSSPTQTSSKSTEKGTAEPGSTAFAPTPSGQISETQTGQPEPDNTDASMTIAPTGDDPTSEPTAAPTTAPLPEEIFPAVNEVGNTNGNISNYGYVARQGDWIYYYSFLDRGLCKIKPDETEKTVIYSGVATYINVQGDWIYFVNSQASNEGIGGAIYKIKTDGSELTLINSLDTYVEDLIVNGNWMYYLSSAEIDWHTYLGASKIFRMRTDGSGRQKLTDDRCENMQVSNNWVFYTSSNNLYKMSVTGDAKSTLINDGSAGKFIADGSVIYYLNINDGNKIYKMYISGENNTKVTENSSRDFNISNGYIYFNNNDDWGALNRVDTNGGGKVRLNKEATFGITIIGNMIYYCIIQVDNYSTNSPIVRMPIDASKPRELFN